MVRCHTRWLWISCPRGLKARIIQGALRGAEAPLFHGGVGGNHDSHNFGGEIETVSGRSHSRWWKSLARFVGGGGGYGGPSTARDLHFVDVMLRSG